MLVQYYLSQHLNWFWVENGPQLTVLCLVAQSCVTLCNPMDCGLPGSYSPGQNIALVSQALLQGIFPTQVFKRGLPHWGQILYHLSHHSRQTQCCWHSKQGVWSEDSTCDLTSLALAVYMACLSAGIIAFELLPVDYPPLALLLPVCRQGCSGAA